MLGAQRKTWGGVLGVRGGEGPRCTAPVRSGETTPLRPVSSIVVPVTMVAVGIVVPVRVVASRARAIDERWRRVGRDDDWCGGGHHHRWGNRRDHDRRRRDGNRSAARTDEAADHTTDESA